MKTLIQNTKILTMTSEQVIENGFIAIENDRIVYVGEQKPENFEADQIIDGKNKAVIPGLVNAHCHIAMTLLRGYADDLPLEEWLFQKVFPIEDKLTCADITCGTSIGLMEMLRTGTTCFADQYFMMDNVARAVEQAGMRANLTRCQMCFDEDVDIQKDKTMQEARAFYQNWHGKADGRIQVTLSPHSVYGCTPRYIEGIVSMAHELGADMQMHLSETAKEVADCQAKYGKSPVQHFHDLGAFDRHAFVAHGVHVSEQDMLLLKNKNVSMVHNPGSNMKLASGVAPIAQYMQNGINVALGTDGACSNNNLNMFEEIQLAALLAKGHFMNATSLKAYEAIQMATVNGATALNLPAVGKIKAGMKADLVMLDLDQPHCYPMHSLISALVYSMNGSDVVMTMVDGTILYQNGEYLTIDAEKVKFEVKQSVARLF
ncbi:MAG: amidohydrolase [Hyphomonadaceae bacterium]|nr:amidohydrolase [Clostridia bacterium]